MNGIAKRTLKREDLQPPLRLDAEVNLDDITLDTLAELDQLRPMGQGNPAVQFYVRNITHQRPLQRMGADKQHVKLWLTDGKTMTTAVATPTKARMRARALRIRPWSLTTP